MNGPKRQTIHIPSAGFMVHGVRRSIEGKLEPVFVVVSGLTVKVDLN